MFLWSIWLFTVPFPCDCTEDALTSTSQLHQQNILELTILLREKSCRTYYQATLLLFLLPEVSPHRPGTHVDLSLGPGGPASTQCPGACLLLMFSFLCGYMFLTLKPCSLFFLSYSLRLTVCLLLPPSRLKYPGLPAASSGSTPVRLTRSSAQDPPNPS